MDGSTASRATCPRCGQRILLNRDGRLRHHYATRAGQRRPCPGSRRIDPGGGVRVLKLIDGVIVKVTHPPGTLDDHAVTNELVLLAAEWAELGRLAAAEAVRAERERIASLAEQMRAIYHQCPHDTRHLPGDPRCLRWSFAALLRRQAPTPGSRHVLAAPSR